MSYASGKMLADVEDGVGLLVFNQPAKLNAMSVEMWQGLAEILDAFERDDPVRVVVLTGTRHKAFVSGADVSEFESSRGGIDALHGYGAMTEAGRNRLASFTKPVIARIRGFSLGGGMKIVLQADLRIAAQDSTFGFPEARLGVAAPPGTVRQLVDVVGPAHAKSLLFTGARVPSQEAGRIGLVNRVVPDQDPSDMVVDIARAIAACARSEDYREGRTAFMEKRHPRFRGQ